MTINIIHDNRRPEKYPQFMMEFANQGISDYKVWEAVIDRPTVVEAINASHKRIVSWAKDMGLAEVCIAEDDLMFTCGDSWRYFLNSKPENFDLYLSSTYIVTEPLSKICGFHLYVVHEKFYDTFLSAPNTAHIDTVMEELGGDFKFCYPFPALQRAGFSANNMAQVNYNQNLDKKHWYDVAVHNL